MKHHNAWRKPGAGGRPPSLEGLFRNLIDRFGGNPPNDHSMIEVLNFLKRGSFLTPVELCGTNARRKLLQVNADVVRLVLFVPPSLRRRSAALSALRGRRPRRGTPSL